METHWGAHVSPWVYCGATHAFLILLLLMGYTVQSLGGGRGERGVQGGGIPPPTPRSSIPSPHPLTHSPTSKCSFPYHSMSVIPLLF